MTEINKDSISIYVRSDVLVSLRALLQPISSNFQVRSSVGSAIHLPAYK